MDTVSKDRVQYERGVQSFIDKYNARKKDAAEAEAELKKLREENADMSTASVRSLIRDSIVSMYNIISYGSADNKFLRTVNSHQGGWYDLRDLIEEIPETKDKNLIDGIIDLIMMDYILFPLRKAWNLQVGAGSQDDDTAMHKVLANKILQVAASIETRWDEDEDDE
jgi:hypothetical protein